MKLRIREMLSLVFLVGLVAGCAAQAPAGPAPGAPAQWDGLVLRSSSRVDALYVHPGADIRSYESVMLDPVEVSFSSQWDPNRGSVAASDRLSVEDIQAIRDGLAGLFREVFEKELAEGGYSLVDSPSYGTLRVTPAIVDLYINAPERNAPGRTRTYTTDAGSMTLVVELRDSVTGDILARAVDAYHGRQTGTLTFSNRNTNTAEARRVFTRWASLLRQAMDEARRNPG